MIKRHGDMCETHSVVSQTADSRPDRAKMMCACRCSEFVRSDVWCTTLHRSVDFLGWSPMHEERRVTDER